MKSASYMYEVALRVQLARALVEWDHSESVFAFAGILRGCASVGKREVRPSDYPETT